MRKGDPHDPLLRQVLPSVDEDRSASGFSLDPVGDLASETRPGLLHKYHGRVLLVVTGACGIHCRYCFRRHFPYAESNAAAGRWQAALEYIRSEPSVREVVLSGGDPLSLTDLRLGELARRVATIPHVQRLRVHTRMPILVPARVDAALIDWLTETRLATVIVVHANHPAEIDPCVVTAMRRLREAGITVLNQSVLLRGVNDSVDVLVELSEALFRAGVLPYYLHLLDRVQGAARYEVDTASARRLMDGVRAVLPGYLVPRLVREQRGAPYKMPAELLQD